MAEAVDPSWTTVASTRSIRPSTWSIDPGTWSIGPGTWSVGPRTSTTGRVSPPPVRNDGSRSPEPRPAVWRTLAGIDSVAGFSSLHGGDRDAVLTYHSVGGIPGTEYRWNLTRDQFREQIETVSERFEVVDLADLVEPARGRKRVAVTFDDGFRNFHGVAAPVLREYQVPATVFVCPDFVGDANPRLLADRHDLGSSAHDVVMTERQIRDVADEALFSVGNHTASHPDLSTLPDGDAIVDEVVGAKRRLERRFGVEVDRFSYPYGEFDERVAAVVDDGHDVAVTGEPSLVRPDPDPLRLPRIDTSQSVATLLFEMTDLGDRLRRSARTLGS